MARFTAQSLEPNLRILALATSTRDASVALLRSATTPRVGSESGQGILETNNPSAVSNRANAGGHVIRPADPADLKKSTETNVRLVLELLPPAGPPSTELRPKSSSKTLISTIKSALDQAQWTPQDLDLIAVTIGPGSFTGIRIGVVTAKTLAYATQASVVGVNTLDVIAQQTRDYLSRCGGNAFDGASVPSHIAVAIDAQRGQVFSGRFPLIPDDRSQQRPVEIVDGQSWLEGIGSAAIASGPGLKKLQSSLVEHKVPTAIAPQYCWYPRAWTVGRIGIQQFLRGSLDDLWNLQPLYVRPSYAEESEPEPGN